MAASQAAAGRKVERVACDTQAPRDELEETVTTEPRADFTFRT